MTWLSLLCYLSQQYFATNTGTSDQLTWSDHHGPIICPKIMESQAFKQVINSRQSYHIIMLFLLLCFFGSRWKKNNPRYIHLTSHQPPPTLHNLTSAWPVMLLANQRLPDGSQILAQIMSLLKSILGKRKFLSTFMFKWRFLKKILNVFFFFVMKYC